VVASLPGPVDRSNGGYVVGEVYGGVLGSKKRKRSELAVGIDGEGVNLYDVRYKNISSDIPNNVLDFSLEINHLICTPSTVLLHLSTSVFEDSNFERRNRTPYLCLYNWTKPSNYSIL
jgi:hypothetical protein